MLYKVITYSAKASAANENERLIARVFEELHEKQPAGVRYGVLRLDDDSFMHLVSNQSESNPLTSLASFEAFQDRIEDRQISGAVHRAATIVGNYGVLQ